MSAPHNVELGIGATTEDSTLYLNDYVVNALKVTPEYIEKEKQKQIEEIKRRESLYRSSAKGYEIKGRIIVLVDYGAATGATLVGSSEMDKETRT